jgi:hypothetical protein
MSKIKSILSIMAKCITSYIFPVILTSIIAIISIVLTIILSPYDGLAIFLICWVVFAIYITVNVIIYSEDSEDFNIIGVIFAITLILFSFLGTYSLIWPNKTIKTESYEPLLVSKTDYRIVLIGKTHTLESIFISDLTLTHPMMCKDEMINSWNNRIQDHWYICAK